MTCIAMMAALLPSAPGVAQVAPYVAEGFAVTEIVGGHSLPSAVAFAPDGRVFVSERAGLLYTYDGLDDPDPQLVVDLSTRVFGGGDRGLLGLATDPRWATSPYVYLLYTHDGPVGSTAPVYDDRCRSASGWNQDGCPAYGVLSRIRIAPDGSAASSEEVLIGDARWCTGWQAHAADHLAFGPDGALYASVGDGASSQFSDYGQHTGSAQAPTPPNPCGDPPVPAGEQLTAPSAEGGALRSQDLLTPEDPTSYDGTIIRIDPDTGAALPDNPLVSNAVADDDAVIAFGLRNPFRFAFRPGTSEVWVGDVGLNSFEEVNRIADPTDAVVENFGWPCYEGAAPQVNWEPLGMDLCEQLYRGDHGPVSMPAYSYAQQASLDPGRCEGVDASISGLAFSQGSPYPSRLDGGLFVGDYSKGCIWVLPAGTDGLPDAEGLETILSNVFPVDMEIGPDGQLYFVDLIMGTLNRLDYTEGNQAPQARLTAAPLAGPIPLTVDFDASASTDDGSLADLQYAWDLDGDGDFNDATGPTAQHTYVDAVDVDASVRVSDAFGATGVASVSLQPGNTPPQVSIDLPTATWRAGSELAFTGSATDAEDGELPPQAFAWQVILHHCDDTGDCHAHPQLELQGVTGSSFAPPEHEYPAHLELVLTVTDSRGLSTTQSVIVQPQTVEVTLQTQPPGLTLSAAGQTAPTPFDLTVIAGSRTTITAPATQQVGAEIYDFTSWSDGGARTHEIVEPGTSPTNTYTASYTSRGAGGGEVLFVSRELSLPGGDAPVVARLEGLGFVVTVVDDDVVSAADAAGMDVVVVSSTTASGKVGSTFASVGVPVVGWNELVYDDMGLVAPLGYGTVASQTQVDVVGGHPASGGLAGVVTVTSSADRFAWGAVGSGAQVVATIVGDSSLAAAFTYEAGAVMASGTAPARRAGLFFDNRTGLWLTDAGWGLFDGIISWAAGGTPDPGPGNVAPVVSAGPDQQVVLPASALLQGQVSDDGQPSPPAATTVEWSVMSGPGPVTFSDASSAVTEAAFTAAGTYVLRLGADDGALVSHDDVMVEVTAAGGGGGEVLFVSRELSLPGGDAPVVARLEGLGFVVTVVDDDVVSAADAAGMDVVVVSSTTASGKVGSTFASVGVPVVGWNELVYDDMGLVAPLGYGTVASQTQVDVVGGHPASGGLAGVVTVTSSADRFAWGAVGSGAQVVATIVGDSSLAAAFTYEAGAVMASGTAPARRAGLFFDNRTGLWLTDAGWGLFDGIISWAAGGTPDPGPGNVAPVVSAGPDQQVVLPASALLQGQVSDDGQPSPPAATTVEWSVMSGPGPVTFSDASSAVTEAAFTAAGTYVLRLGADDGALVSHDDVMVEVTAAGGGEVLFVSRELSLPGGDAPVVARLEGLGFVVTVVDDDVVSAADAAGMDVVVVSSTTASGKVGSTFASVGVPVVGWNELVYDDMGLVAPLGYGTVASQTQVDVVGGHPASGGLAGVVTVTSSADRFAWGAVGSGAQVVATIVGDSSLAAAFTYEAGAVMASGTAPARRAGLFFDNRTGLWLTDAGWGLFDGIISWAAGG